MDGEAAFDESMITGESEPVGHEAGRSRRGRHGRRPTARSGSGSTPSGTTRPSRGSSASSMEAQASRSRAQALADRAAAILFYVAVGAGALTFVVWSAIGEHGRGRRARRHRARDRLPARARARDPAGDRDLDRCRRSSGDPGQGSPRPRADANGGRGAVRQDRHADQGCSAWCARSSASARRARRSSRLAAAVEASSEHPLARAIVEAARTRPRDPRRVGVPFHGGSRRRRCGRRRRDRGRWSRVAA